MALLNLSDIPTLIDEFSLMIGSAYGLGIALWFISYTAKHVTSQIDLIKNAVIWFVLGILSLIAFFD